MSDLLSLGASGVHAYQTALTTTSENIANTGVAGYSRRTTNLTEIAAVGGGYFRRSIGSGNGVIASGVSRVADQFRSGAVRQAGADLAKSEAGAVWLGRIETSLTDNDLGDRLTGFFNAATKLAADPSSVPSRAVMLEQAGSVAAAFTATGAALDRARGELDQTTAQGVASLNSYAESLARVNDGLSRVAPNSNSAAQLMDQRDQLLERMSGLSDVSVEFDAIGRANVKLGGSAGALIVAGGDAGHLSFAANGEGAISFAVQRQGTRAVMTPSGGSLSGAVDGAQRLADARAALNGLARDFVAAVNGVQAKGENLDGTAGQPMFASGATPSDVSLVLDDPRGVAAAKPGGGVRDATNLSALQAARTSGGFEARVTATVTANAAALEQRQLVSDAQSSILDGAVAARDAVSAVDLDTEAVELMRFQQAYQASARVIQVARETMQSILEIR